MEQDSNDNLPEFEVKTFKPKEPDEILDSEEISASAQIVADISATPTEFIESAFPEKTIPETAELVLNTETTQPIVSALEPIVTGTYQLVNAMVDKPYKAKIDLKELRIETAGLKSDFADQVEKLGLSVAREGNIIQIEGAPIVDAHGEHLLCLDYAFEGEIQTQRKKFILLINPDPKSLWKNLEPDENLPYRKDHLATDLVLSEDFKMVAASRRGRSHAHEGKFREDDFAVKAIENGWHILIVSDGAGSAQLSRRGSYLACQTALESLEKSIADLLEPKFDSLIREFASAATENSHKEIKNLLYQVLCGAAFASYKRLEQESATTGNPLKDFSATLLIAIVKKCAKGFFIASFGIGDGAIGVYQQIPSNIELMITPDGGEFSGQTRFLTMREVIGDGNEMLKRIKFKLFEKFNVLALMTDGISDPKFGTDNNLVSSEKWKEFVDELAKTIDFSRSNSSTPEQLLDYMDFWSPGEHDDRTLAILY